MKYELDKMNIRSQLNYLFILEKMLKTILDLDEDKVYQNKFLLQIAEKMIENVGQLYSSIYESFISNDEKSAG